MRRVWLVSTRFMIGFQIAALAAAATACSGGGASDATSSGAGGRTGSGGDTSSSGTLPPHGDFPLNAPATVTTGTAFLVSWAVSGATSCAGSATLNGSSTDLAGWTDSTSATSPRSVTAPSDGTYVLTLKCTNAGGNANSQPATVVASTAAGDGGTDGGTDDDCLNPGSRLMTSSISYVPSGTGTRVNVDVTSWDNIWGHSTGSDTVVPWPGRSDSAPALLNFGKTQYLAAKFHVPADVSTEALGWITHTEYNWGHDLTASITTKCGDFNPANSACLTDMTGAPDLVPWRTKPGSFCQLTPGQDYYLNIKLTDPAGPSTTCTDSATQCVIGTANNFSVP